VASRRPAARDPAGRDPAVRDRAGRDAPALGGLSTAARLLWATCIGALLLAAALAAAVSLGARPIDLGLALDAARVPNPDRVLLFDARLPRVVLGAIVGAGLGGAGAALQALLRNPLADPFVLGTSGGAALGATLAIASGVPALALGAQSWLGDGGWLGSGGLLGALGGLALPAAAFSGALAATALVLGIARLSGGAGGAASGTSVLLAGIIVNAFATAGITLVKVLVPGEAAQELLFWLVGTLGYETWGTLALAGAWVIAGTLALVALSGRLHLLALGDEAASTLGVDVRRTRWAVLVLASLVVGGVVALSGLIGFVGLVVPHAVRRVVGPDHRVVLPASALVGAAFLVLADLGTRLLLDRLGTEPPVGALTALVGCPVFLALLVGTRRRAA
jgi:iron complex transport system permease protein